MENSKLKKKLKELEDQLMDSRCSPVRSVGNETCLSFQSNAALSCQSQWFCSLSVHQNVFVFLFYLPRHLFFPFSPFHSSLSFSLSLSLSLSVSLPTPSALSQHLHVNVSNEPYILQKLSALSWCGDDVTSLSSLEISSVTLTPVSSPDSSQSASLLTLPPAKPTHSQPTSGYIMPRPRVNVSYTKNYTVHFACDSITNFHT